MASNGHSPPATPQVKAALEVDNTTPKAEVNEEIEADSSTNMPPPMFARSGQNNDALQDSSNNSAPNPNPPLAEAQSENGESQHGIDDIQLAELVDMDWREFNAQYMAALEDAYDEEDSLTNEFGQYADAFLLWADASSRRETERARKRLKTRERYVNISEQHLEEKKERYIEVVAAFKKALSLL